MITSEAEGSEDTAVAAYESAMRQPLPVGTDSIVQRQYAKGDGYTIECAHAENNCTRDAHS